MKWVHLIRGRWSEDFFLIDSLDFGKLVEKLVAEISLPSPLPTADTVLEIGRQKYAGRRQGMPAAGKVSPVKDAPDLIVPEIGYKRKEIEEGEGVQNSSPEKSPEDATGRNCSLTYQTV